MGTDQRDDSRDDLGASAPSPRTSSPPEGADLLAPAQGQTPGVFKLDLGGGEGTLDDLDGGDLEAALADAVSQMERAAELRRAQPAARGGTKPAPRSGKRPGARTPSRDAPAEGRKRIRGAVPRVRPGSRAAAVAAARGAARLVTGSRPGVGSLGQQAAERVRELEGKLQQAEAEKADHKRKLGQMQAETVSFRKRLEGQAEQARKRGREDVFRALLGIIDNLDAAISGAAANRDFDMLFQGIEMTLRQLLGTMPTLGLETFGAVGDTFDPARHEAFRTATTNRVPPGSVAEVLRRGFLFEGTLLRPALVVVEARGTETSPDLKAAPVPGGGRGDA